MLANGAADARGRAEGASPLIRYAAEAIDSWGNRADLYSGAEDEPDILSFIGDSLERLTQTA
jgi:hypothetical protein